MNTKAITKRIAHVIILSSALALGYEAHAYRNDAPDQAIHTAAAKAQASGHGNAFIALPDFTGIVAKEGPAVVNISVSAKVAAEDSGIPGFPGMSPDDPFYQFFRHFQPPAPHGTITTRALGSGFIVSKNGIILTNAHVVDHADKVIVKLTDQREFKAKVIGEDKPSDVAVLKINADNLPTVTIGDPQKVRVGQWVVAIGSPFGFQNSVTAGIVSAKSRSLPDEGYVPFLQTDVAVNPGNSGGPLIDANGEVIGINSQIYTRSGGYQGLSFAIPIDVAMNVERQILAHGKVSRGRLGVTIQPVDEELAQTFGLDRPEGALVSSVENDSPAEKAGIKPGDIIIKFNGRNVSSSSDLPPMVAELEPGTNVSLVVWRKDGSKTIALRVGALATAVAANGSTPKKTMKHAEGMLGMEVRPLTPDERKQVGTTGLVVENVDDNGAAARAGIEPGDIVIAVNGSDVNSGKELRTQVARHKRHVALLIQRNGQQVFVPVRVG
ncbi:MAG TPA: DegQ family serine endoprotease [Gallionellaceae bacterium]|nr:DegQ family serine endoprotease [Gallionellaceae bacterium]